MDINAGDTQEIIREQIRGRQRRLVDVEGQLRDAHALQSNAEMMADPVTKFEVDASVVELERNVRVARFLLEETEHRLAVLEDVARGAP